LNRLYDIIRKLRKECPWDSKQTEESLIPYIIEESYELIDAIERGSVEEKKDELGDFLLQFLLQVAINEEKGNFTMDDVLRHLEEKLIRRHPHVFGDVKAETEEEVMKNWDEIKKREKKHAYLMDSVNRNLPALMYAKKVQKIANKVGFDWDTIEGVYDKMHEEINELKDAKTREEKEEELGDILFVASHLGNFIDIDAETALKKSNDKFIKRFNLMEDMLRGQGKNFEDASIDELEELWQKAKEILKEKKKS